MPSVRNAALIQSLSSIFRRLNNPTHAWGDVASIHLALPQLRGFWPMSSVNESGNALDLSGQGRTLTNNSSLAYGAQALTAYAIGDGTADYLSRADEAGLDITGGLTLGGWFRFDNTASGVENFMGKRGATGNLSYFIRRTGGGFAQGLVSSNGTAITSAISAAAMAATTWYHVVFKFTPSTEVAVFLNGTKAADTTSIPASIFNSTTAFTIGANGVPGEFHDGWSTLCFLCAASLSDDMITALYEASRPMMEVT